MPTGWGYSSAPRSAISTSLMSLKERHKSLADLPPHAAFHCFNHSAACVLSSLLQYPGAGPHHDVGMQLGCGCRRSGDPADSGRGGGRGAGGGHRLRADTRGAGGSRTPRARSASATTTSPGARLRTVRRRRDGNVIGEGAAALLLESEPHARRRQARVYARVAGYRIASAGQNRQYSHDDAELDIRPSVRAVPRRDAGGRLEPRSRSTW